jgi:hypothetical protein
MRGIFNESMIETLNETKRKTKQDENMRPIKLSF